MKYGLLGKVLGHSYSPRIHALLGNPSYELCALPEDALPAFLKEKAFLGLNVTIPYKQTVIPYLSDVSEQAKAIGSVNTIVKDASGALHGYNTDYFGLLAMADRADIRLEGKKVLVLGSGGTSLTARAVARFEHAREVVVISRTGEDNYGNLERHADADVIINTTPVGMYPNVDAAPLSLSGFPKLSAVLDVIYNPLKTKLLAEARERCIPCANGLYMLVAQAKYADDLFFDRKRPDTLIQDVYEELVREVRKENN